MKKFVKALSVLLAIFLNSCAAGPKVLLRPGAPVTLPTKSEVIDMPNLSKKQIFDQANAWAVREFKKAYSVIEYTNFDTGVISGKYTYDALDNAVADYSFGNYSKWSLVRMFISIECRDGKMRLLQQPVDIFLSYPAEWQTITTTSEPYLNFENESTRVKESLTQFVLQNAW